MSKYQKNVIVCGWYFQSAGRRSFVKAISSNSGSWLCDVVSIIVLHEDWICTIAQWRTNTHLLCILSIALPWIHAVIVSQLFKQIKWINAAAVHQIVTKSFLWSNFGIQKCSEDDNNNRLRLSHVVFFALHVTVLPINIHFLRFHRQILFWF